MIMNKFILVAGGLIVFLSAGSEAYANRMAMGGCSYYTGSGSTGRWHDFQCIDKPCPQGSDHDRFCGAGTAGSGAQCIPDQGTPCNDPKPRLIQH